RRDGGDLAVDKLGNAFAVTDHGLAFRFCVGCCMLDAAALPALKKSPHPAASRSLGGDPPPPGEGDGARGSVDAGLPAPTPFLARLDACAERAATTSPGGGGSASRERSEWRAGVG